MDRIKKKNHTLFSFPNKPPLTCFLLRFRLYMCFKAPIIPCAYPEELCKMVFKCKLTLKSQQVMFHSKILFAFLAAKKEKSTPLSCELLSQVLVTERMR